MIRIALSIAYLTALMAIPSGGRAERITEDKELFGELSPEQYRILREYERHRIDLADGGIEELLDIPGFPPGLAARISQLERKYGNRWFEHLKPPEKKLLYRYRRWIKLPASGDRFDLDARFSARSCGNAGRERFFVSARAGDWKGVYRSEISDNRRIATAMVKAAFAGDAFRLYGGDFCPDIPLGLLSSSSFFSYQHSSGYPIRNYRWVGTGTGFYGNSMRGTALQLKGSFFRVACFTGNRRKYDFTYEREKTAGAAMEFNCRAYRYGAAVLKGDGITLKGFHFRYIPDEGLDFGIEAALSPGGETAWSAGLKCRLKGFRAGFLLYSVGSGFRSGMGKIPGAGTSVAGEKRGMGASARKRLYRGLYAAFCAEGIVKRTFYSRERKVSASARLDARKKGSSLILEWKFDSLEKGRLVPFPPVQSEITDGKGKIKSIINLRLSNQLRLRTSCRYIYGSDCGVMIYPSARLSAFNGSLQTDLGVALYSSVKGNPLFYAYVPSARGGYPWKRLSGEGRFMAARIKFKLKNLSLCISINGESGDELESGIQISALF
ncbi:MAG: hypothetical protein R6U43_00200 [Candidatus Krumholzibacteriales bacterium]